MSRFIIDDVPYEFEDMDAETRLMCNRCVSLQEAIQEQSWVLNSYKQIITQRLQPTQPNADEVLAEKPVKADAG